MIAKVRIMGTVNNVVSEQFEAAKKSGNGESFWEGVAGGVADVLIVAHREKIAAALRRVGIDVGDEEVLNQKVIVDLIAKKTEIEINSFDVDEVMQKVLKKISGVVSERLGFEVDLTKNYEDMLKDAALSALASGRLNKLVPDRIAKKSRFLAAAAQVGFSEGDYKRWKDAKKSREWRKNKKFVWVER